MKGKELTYRKFLDSIGEHRNCPINITQADAIISHFKPAKEIISHYAPTTFLLDYATKKYIHVGESCFNNFGYRASWFLETGLEQYLENWHPSDYNIINTKVFPDNIQFLKTLLNEEVSNYIISYNYRFRNAYNVYITVLQRFSFIPGDMLGEPAGVVGIALDITHFKNDNSIIHTIEKVIETAAGNVNELMFKKIHPVYDLDTDINLTGREVEILQLLSKGLSSKQIASQMLISTNTVNNHRKNMLAKTDCKTSSELVKYAIKHGLV